MSCRSRSLLWKKKQKLAPSWDSILLRTLRTTCCGREASPEENETCELSGLLLSYGCRGRPPRYVRQSRTMLRFGIKWPLYSFAWNCHVLCWQGCLHQHSYFPLLCRSLTWASFHFWLACSPLPCHIHLVSLDFQVPYLLFAKKASRNLCLYLIVFI